jgi:hypothetical protein
MPVIESVNVIEDSFGSPLRNAGVPGVGTDELWTLTIGGTPSGGTFKLKFGPFVSGDIPWSSVNATLLASLQSALNAMPNVQTNGFIATAGTLTAGVGTILLTAGGNLTKLAVPEAWVVHTNALTGGGTLPSFVETTPGVTATFRGAPRGRLAVNVSTGVLYAQTSGNPLAPTWTAQA